LKAIGLICLATYLAFCGTLYFAGNGKDFNDPFVQVAGNTTPSEPAPVETPKASKSGKRAGSKPATNASASPSSKPKSGDAQSRTPAKKPQL
jgi:hypothetical protein